MAFVCITSGHVFVGYRGPVFHSTKAEVTRQNPTPAVHVSSLISLHHFTSSYTFERSIMVQLSGTLKIQNQGHSLCATRIILYGFINSTTTWTREIFTAYIGIHMERLQGSNVLNSGPIGYVSQPWEDDVGLCWALSHLWKCWMKLPMSSPVSSPCLIQAANFWKVGGVKISEIFLRSDLIKYIQITTRGGTVAVPSMFANTREPWSESTKKLGCSWHHEWSWSWYHDAAFPLISLGSHWCHSKWCTIWVFCNWRLARPCFNNRKTLSPPNSISWGSPLWPPSRRVNHISRDCSI